MPKGPLEYGRYDDDPDHVGCPRAKTDMTPCVARDGAAADDDGVCVGCGEMTADLLTALVLEVTLGGPMTGMIVEDAAEFPYIYRREGDEHLIVDRRDEHVVGRYGHFGDAVAIGAALNEEHNRQRA